MKLLNTISIFVCLFTLNLSAQVGINTTNPQETLHVVGTARIETTNQVGVTTTKVTGLDNSGTLREIYIGSNLKLTNNTLSSNFDYYFGSVSFSTKTNHNIDLLLDPGEANEGKHIIRINNSAGDTEITGIKDGYDGQHIWIYAQGNEVKLLDNNAGSNAGNRIEVNDKMAAKDWGMIELVYDGTRSKWIIMQHHN